MASQGQITFLGKSGNKYVFDIYDLKCLWNKVAVIYIVTRAEKNESGGNIHYPIYIGQTDNLEERFSNHHKQNCFDQNKASHLCIIVEANEKNRLDAESDLLGQWKTPCND